MQLEYRCRLPRCRDGIACWPDDSVCVRPCCATDGDGEKRSLKLTLVKQTPTKGNLHWTRVLEAVAAG